ncbi:MAG TPA: DUF4446 family protein [Thermoleophilaceae bacterium]|nr:DUF4446 family protein [Thermoleophilaceae bacterium]
MDELTSTTGIVALAAAVVAVVALLLAVVLAVRLRRLRATQTAVLGPHGNQDVVAYARQVGDGFTDLRDWVEGALAQVDERLGKAAERIDGCVAYSSLIRYDAYGEMSGHQSSSVALLDARRSGVVISSILHRDQARVYVKELHEGVPSLELSPEEQEAVDTALAGRAPTAA